MKLFSHAAAALLEGALVATIILVLVVGTAFAAKGGPVGGGGGGGGGHKGGGGTTSGVCVATPGTVAAGGSLTISGSGLKSGTALNVWVAGSEGTQILPTATDATGAYTRLAYAYGTGTDSVSVHDMYSGAVLQSCTFTVQ